ncbi:MAG: DUF4445 domain-containing protein [Acidobacteria bacterium]|nr:DUF4445 domain-containing protein [Acidobacteriota bacterium]
MPVTHRVAFSPSGRQGSVPDGARLLDAASSLGVEIESICGGRQMCGKCQVSVETGEFAKHGMVSRASNLSPVSAREQAYWDHHVRTEDRRLACAATVCGDLSIFIPPESAVHKQVVAKGAAERVIEVRPAVRQYYVECEAAQLDDRRGDWERLQKALHEQWGLHGLSIGLFALRQLQSALRDGGHAVSVAVWQGSEVLRVQPGYAEGVYGIAIDVGSTTLAGYLSDLRTGQLLSTAGTVNPQIRFGEDLMSRVSYAMTQSDGTARLHEAVVAGLNELIGECIRDAGVSPEQVLDLVLVGNSVMHHLMLGIDPSELGGAPFALSASGAFDLTVRDLGITAASPAARAHLLPCIAGQNGADNMAVLLAEMPHRKGGAVLVADIGTNAEILLGSRDRIWAASSPTGPAFEGAQIQHGQRAAPGAIERVRIDPGTRAVTFKVIGSDVWSHEPGAVLPATGICGSGIIEAIAEMRRAGIIRADGRFEERGAGFVIAAAHQTSIGAPIVVTQNDVRAIQLAKAALCAGIKLLMNRAGVTRLDEIRLAGAFGSFISPRHAMAIGMIPECEVTNVIAVGNAAGDGARIALLDRETRAQAPGLARMVEYVSIAVEPSFQDEFVAAMALPGGPAAGSAPERSRRERRRQLALAGAAARDGES